VNVSADSVKKRYIFSLAVNILLCIPRLLVASLVPRALGPAAYGDYQFLINNLTSVKNFLDFGTSTAFFTHNAKTEESSNLNIQYLLWWFFQLALIVLGVFAAYSLGVYTHIWPGQDIENIALAAVSVWLFLFAQQLVQFGDSKGLTILCQKTNLFANYAAASLLALMYWRGLLSIKIAMLIYITGPIVLITFLMIKFYKKYFITNQSILSGFDRNYAYFKKFCAPLLIVTIAGFSTDFLDRWMLQKFAGSTAQGYYSLSYNWAAISLLFFNPMLNIFWREVSQLVSNDQKDKIGELFIKFAKLMFVITAFISVFLAFNAKEILLLIAGKKFEGATLSFIIMIFFPLVQVYGQLTGCVYFAMEKTSLYRNITIWLALFCTSISYFVLAPVDYYIPGFACGASGFSLKIFLTNLIGTDIIVYFACKINGVNYFKLIYHRLTVLLILFVSFFSGYSIVKTFTGSASIYFQFFLKTSLSFVIVSLIFNNFYNLLGLSEKPSRTIKKYIYKFVCKVEG
jgi:O-antigen/teichoic acid export membrane protein